MYSFISTLLYVYVKVYMSNKNISKHDDDSRGFFRISFF